MSRRQKSTCGKRCHRPLKLAPKHLSSDRLEEGPSVRSVSGPSHCGCHEPHWQRYKEKISEKLEIPSLSNSDSLSGRCKKKNQIWYLKWGSPMTLKVVKQQKKQEDLLSYFNVSEDKIHWFFKAQLTVQIIISSIL